ncbi:MAG: filamentous hemagglutinin N-terminal domain-containing protein, partial [Rhodocyclaceae bacterium]|nr:filamentous hemagglutinin N-terminal domain-containing protein [Rhodocyclaceae bacterium]
MRSQARTFQPHPIAGCLARLGQRGEIFPLLAGLLPGLAFAELPAGGAVVGGAASATIGYPAANRMVVNQVIDRSIINWQSFSIGSGNYVQFIQPSSSSVVLNRVVGGSPSDILGSMSANGQVFLVNPNGVFFGAGASIDVAGLVATTLAIRDQDFLAGNHVFSRDAASPALAKVTNAGTIAARDGGYVVLAGDYAANTGVIQARLGTVALAAGNKLTLDLQGDRLINFAVNEKTLASLAGVANAGQLLADGGRVVMTAAVAGDLAATVVNNTGLVQAQSMVEHDGSIYLAADGGSIRVGGTLDAS